ncbi:MAG TPA: hypothetical protein VNJ54_21235 [Plantibacter sp.]|uniref:hypothetical protein n=1 Tax=Plantibacter sp. TaxID=1871045 RepID=UPI002BBEE706|nr:hypothetical protein [Plantibacter sp.]
MSDHPMQDEADRWFYDLGHLAEVVDRNQSLAIAAQHKADDARKRTLVLTAFVLFAFLLLSWRSEVNSGRINDSNAAIGATQAAACLSGLEILRKFNLQQDALITIERTNQFIDDTVRAARIMAYENARIMPLPVCPP